MSNPLRVQKGTAAYDFSITRPGLWGNPFIIGIHGTRAEVIQMYREWLPNQPELMARLPELKGKVLGCACRADQKCHGDVILFMLNKGDRP
jgi:hypothetical protein